MSHLRALAALLGVVLVGVLQLGCTALPKGVTPVRGFVVGRYLGEWHEVARLDHRFERGLTRVTATYSLRTDGGIRVVNRGWLAAKGRWKEAEGRAYLAGAADEGRLKVSFFGPFYGTYAILALDPERYALVCGPDRSYLWILARQLRLDAPTLARLVQQARELGFATDKLIYL